MCGIAGWFDKNIDFSEKKEVIGKVSQYPEDLMRMVLTLQMTLPLYIGDL